MRPAARRPVRAAARRLRTVRARRASTTRPRRARPGRGRPAAAEAARRPVGPSATDSLTTAGPTRRPSGPTPYLAGWSSGSTTTPSARGRVRRGRARRRVRPAAGRRRGPGHAPTAPRSCATRARRCTAVLLNLRPTTPSSATRGPARAPRGDRPGRARRRASTAGRATAAPTARSRRPRRCSTRPAEPPVAFDRRPPRRRRSRPPAGPEGRRLAPARREGAADASRSLSPDRAANPVAFAAAARPSSTTGRRSASTSTHVALPAGEFVTDRLCERRRSRRPSRTSPSASTRTSTRCWRRARPGPAARTSSGVQDPALDKLLVAARDAGHAGRPRGGVLGPPEARSRRADTCSRSPSRTSPSWSATRSTDPLRGRSPTRRTDFGMC